MLIKPLGITAEELQTWDKYVSILNSTKSTLEMVTSMHKLLKLCENNKHLQAVAGTNYEQLLRLDSDILNLRNGGRTSSSSKADTLYMPIK